MSERDDLQLQRYLSGDSPVSEAFGALDKAEPPAHLDAAILGAARGEAAKPRRPAWLLPTALAATITLGLGLSWQQMRAPMATMSDLDAQRVNEKTHVSQPADVAVQSESSAPTPTARAPAMPQFDMAPLPVPPPRAPVTQRFDRAPLPAPPTEEFEDADVSRDARASIRESTEAQIRQSRESIMRAEVLPVPEPARARSPSEVTVIGQMTIGEAAQAKSSRQIPVDERKRHFTVTPPFEDEAAAKDDVSDGYRDSAAGSLSASGIQSLANEARSTRESDQIRDRRFVATYRENPAAVLELIRDLHADGREDAARDLFDAFVEAWPDYPLPDDFPLDKATATTPENPAPE